MQKQELNYLKLDHHPGFEIDILSFSYEICISDILEAVFNLKYVDVDRNGWA